MTAIRFAIRRNGFNNAPVIYDAGRGEKFDVAHVYGQGNADIEAQWRHAALLAAAPRLLAALEKIVVDEERRAADLRHREAWLSLKFSEARLQEAREAIAEALLWRGLP